LILRNCTYEPTKIDWDHIFQVERGIQPFGDEAEPQQLIAHCTPVQKRKGFPGFQTELVLVLDLINPHELFPKPLN